MSSELARRLIREAVAAIELPPVRIPDAGPARQSAVEHATACDAGQPAKTPCNGTGRVVPNEATARPVSEGRAAPRMPFAPGAALGAAGKTPGATPAAVAQVVGVSRQTIWRWSRLPEFATELRRLHTLAVMTGRGPMNKFVIGRV